MARRKAPRGSSSSPSAIKPSPSFSPGAPRFDKTQKLLCRFYEPLVLFSVLGNSKKDTGNTPYPKESDQQQWTLTDVRRVILKHLAYLCDHETGGDSVTAIGISKTPEKRTFWVAANTRPDTKILPFLETLLLKLRDTQYGSTTSLEITHLCIDYARKRIQAYLDFIRRAIQESLPFLEERNQTSQDSPLILFLHKFIAVKKVNYDICRLAYENSHCPEMTLLKYLCAEPSFTPAQDSLTLQFRRVRHYIGRLAYQIKAVQILVSLIDRLPAILDDYEVRGLQPPPRAPSPLVDAKTNLMSMVVRMLPAGSEEVKHYQQILREMDAAFDIEQDFLRVYSSPTFRPRVHAEVQVLDHFYQHHMEFEDSDRFVACSKPACYCCHSYFSHHPLNPIRPPTHQNVPPQWAPPVENATIDRCQRDIMNDVIKDVRRDVLQQIELRQFRKSWHPDSTTGISSTLKSLHDEEQLWDEFSDLSDIGSDLGDYRDDAASLYATDGSVQGSARGSLGDMVEDASEKNVELEVQPNLDIMMARMILESSDDDEDSDGGVTLSSIGQSCTGL